MPGLPQALFDDVVKQILANVQNEGDRRDWLAAQLNQHPVFQRIDWSKSAHTFAVHIVETLSHDQLITALRRLPCGVEQGPSIESLCDQIATLKVAPAGPSTDPRAAYSYATILGELRELPNPPNPFYAPSREPLGRDEEIGRIRAKLQAGDHCAIVGPMGSGKSLLLKAIQNESPSWLGCQSRQVLYIDVQGITSLRDLKRDVVTALGGLKADEWRTVVRELRLLLLDNLGAMDRGAHGLQMRHWLRSLGSDRDTQLLVASNERLKDVFRDDSKDYSTLDGLAGPPIKLDPLSVETRRQIVALRLKGTGLDPASFFDLFQSLPQPRDLLRAAAARYQQLVNAPQ